MNKKIDNTNFHDFHQSNLKKSLIETSKEELVGLLLELSNTYDRVNYDLKLKYAVEDDLLEICISIMDRYVKEEIIDGVIKRKSIVKAITGADQVFLNAVKLKNEGKIRSAVELSMAILSIFIPVLDISEDEDNIISYLIDSTIDFTRTCVETAREMNFGVKERREIYSTIMDEAILDYYYKWIDWRCDILSCCILLCDDTDIRDSLISVIEVLIKSGKNNKWHKLLVEKELKQLIFRIKNDYVSYDDAIKYAEENQEYSYFRKKAIETALSKKQYEKVIYLTGRKIETIGRDIEDEIENYRYQAYEGLGDKENQRIMAENFLLQGKLEYYLVFKKLSSEKDWNTTFDVILELFSEEQPNSGNYIKLILLEKRYDKLLEAAKNSTTVLMENLLLLHANYNIETETLLLNYLLKKENSISTREDYTEIIRIIKGFYSIGKKEEAFDKLYELKKIYAKNDIFLEELYNLEDWLESESEEVIFRKEKDIKAIDGVELDEERVTDTKGGRIINLPFK